MAIEEITQQAPALADTPLAEISIGIVLGLLGWPLYAGLVRIAGAMVGLAGALALVLVGNEFYPLGDWLILALVVASAVGTLLGIWFIRRLVMIVWLLLGASLGVLSVWALHYQVHSIGLEELSQPAQLAIWSGAALVVGVATLLMRRWLVMAVTSALGAAMIAPHLAYLGPPVLAWWGAWAVSFLAIQVGIHRTIGLVDDDEEEEDDEDE